MLSPGRDPSWEGHSGEPGRHLSAAPPQAATAVGDAQLITWSLAEPERFGELYHRHAADVHWFVASRLGADDAEDVTAETFITAFRIRDRFDVARDSARPWLLGIAVREIAHRRRAERTRYRMFAKLRPQPVVDGAGEQVVAASLHGAVAGALHRLRHDDRDALLLRVWGELSYEEVAEALDVPVGTVRSRLHRARRVLRAALPDIRDSYQEDPTWTN